MHGDAPWVIVNVWPAIVSVPVRETVVGFASAPNITLPLPVPLAPLKIDAQPTPLVAVHAQPAVVVTVIVPLPPAKPTCWLRGEMV